MLPISNMFEEIQLESYIEDLTEECCKTYGEEFVDAAVKYLAEDDSTDIDLYFESYNILTEITRRDIGAAREKVKKEALASARAVKPKKSLVRKLTNKMYKNKVGKAIVRGIRKAGYGTKLGRYIMKGAQSFRQGASMGLRKTAMDLASTSSKAHLLADKYKKDGNKKKESHYEKEASYFAKESGKTAGMSKNQLRHARAIGTGLGVTRKGFERSQLKKAPKMRTKFAHA